MPLTKNIIKIAIGIFVVAWAAVFFIYPACAQDQELEFTVDIASNKAMPLPKIFRPAVDLSGRGFNRNYAWPQGMASPEAISEWQNDMGFKGIYRLQYNLWEISQLNKDKESQAKLLDHYEQIIKKINDAGGLVILNIFSTPSGLGKVLDKKSSPWDYKAFKALIKSCIRRLSCEKKFNIWYEVWSAPDLDEFFLGRKEDYFNLYKAVAESVKELEQETKSRILLGGPSTSWWFQNFEGNTILDPEKSLIYELIKFCYRYRLPLDFISWHAYSTDPRPEKETTVYRKAPVALIRDWLSYFNLPRETPLIIDEWNYDSDSNILAERKERSFVSASYVPSRIKQMHEAGLDYQVFYALEDFQNNKEGVVRNVGVFWYEEDPATYKGGRKSIFTAFKMLSLLEDTLLPVSVKAADAFVDMIATKSKDSVALVLFNYIDPDTFHNFLTRNISALDKSGRKVLLRHIKAGTIEKIISKEQDIVRLKLPKRVKEFLLQAQKDNDAATKYMYSARNIVLNIKSLHTLLHQPQNKQMQWNGAGADDPYVYQRYIMDSSCSMNCVFSPVEEKEISLSALLQEKLVVNPYSVQLILIKKKPRPAVEVPQEPVPSLVTLPGQQDIEVKEPSKQEHQPAPKLKPGKQESAKKEGNAQEQAKQNDASAIPVTEKTAGKEQAQEVDPLPPAKTEPRAKEEKAAPVKLEQTP